MDRSGPPESVNGLVHICHTNTHPRKPSRLKVATVTANGKCRTFEAVTRLVLGGI